MSESQRTSPEAAADAARICACFNFRRAARSVTRLFNEVLEPSGLKSTQFVLLVTIHANEAVDLPVLSEQMGLDRSVLTRRLRPLEQEGYLQVRASPSGGASTARLTAKGRRKLDRTVPLWEAAQSRFEDQLGSSRWRDMLGDLGAAHSAAQQA